MNFLLLRHENRDKLSSFAVDLDEDPTDIFGAVCALLVSPVEELNLPMTMQDRGYVQ